MGRALDLPPHLLAEDLYDAVRSINQVHGDGDLPFVPVLLRVGLSVRSTFIERDGSPVAIVLRSDVRHRDFALIHEVGHLLDFAGLGTASPYATAGDDALLQPWKRAIARSEAVQRLTMLIDELVTLPPTEERVRGLGARVLLQPEELWARSHAQYVTHLSGNPRLLAALNADRGSIPGRVYYPTQWSDEDFLPIGEAIETLFRRIGWRSQRTA